jgi:pyruvate-formate lyase-activating enzyme
VRIKLSEIRARLTGFRSSQPDASEAEQPQSNVVLRPGDYDQIVEIARPLSRDALNGYLTGDVWEDNLIINIWEYVHHVSTLESYPWRVYLPIADSCNARCEFCTSWLYKDLYLRPAALETFSDVLKRARYIDLCGYGEPLANPDFAEITAGLAQYVDRRSEMVLYSNGALLDRWIDRLLDLGVKWFAFSLNAATAATHDAVMGLGPNAFDKIIAAIQKLHADATARGKTVYITASFVVTATNIHEAAEFVEICNTLPLFGAYIRVLQLAGGHRVLNDLALPPYLHDRFEEHRARTVAAISASKLQIWASPENWSLPVLPPDLDAHARKKTVTLKTREEIARTRLVIHEASASQDDLRPSDGVDDSVPADNPFNRFAPYDCTYPYHTLLVGRTQITPCCFMNEVPGMGPIKFDGSRPFREIWNGPQMVRVRETLARGPLLRNCMVCPSSRT